MEMATYILGGIGLFLIGIRMMTDGLRAAAGGLLERILASATASPLRALSAGILITAVVRSSSAVTVATIGFVNAGLLGLAAAVWVVFGTNIGTTTTAWLVVLAGTGFDAATMALPMVGIGMLARLAASGSERVAGLGQAMAGFGAFFLGIGFLQQGFDDVAPAIAAAGLDPSAWFAVPAFVVLGFLLTVVTQSSSAAIAIALTASAGGSVPLALAAAAVIGTNIGTTSTAALAALGATAPAKRVAAAHVVFNLVTGAIALLLLPWLVAISDAIVTRAEGHADYMVTLALFHTVFNCLGVVFMAGFAGRMVSWLGERFVSQDEKIGRPRHLDATLVDVPELALRALAMETDRMAQIAFDVARTRIAASPGGRERVAGLHVGALRLGSEIKAVVGKLNKRQLPAEVAAAIPDQIRGVQHLEEVLRVSAQLQGMIPLPHPMAQNALERMRAVALESLPPLVSGGAGYEDGGPVSRAEMLKRVEETYEGLKTALLDAAGRGAIEMGVMERAFLEIRLLRRCAQEAVKARRRLAPRGPDPTQPAPPDAAAAPGQAIG